MTGRALSSHRLQMLAVLLTIASGSLPVSAQVPRITLSQYTYQTVKTPPFNGQLAVYAPDIVSSGNQVRLPLTLQVLIGNGRRPFAVDTGAMKPPEFSTYVSRVTATKMIRVIPFRIGRRGETMTFTYLSRVYVLTATELIPCRGCDDRVVLTLQPK